MLLLKMGQIWHSLPKESNLTEVDVCSLRRSPELSSSFNYFAILWVWGRETFLYCQESQDINLFPQTLNVWAFLSSQIRIKTKLWIISFWSLKCFRLTKYSALYFHRVTQSTDLTKYFNTPKTLMKAAYPMQHFYLLSPYINLSTGNCSTPTVCE